MRKTKYILTPTTAVYHLADVCERFPNFYKSRCNLLSAHKDGKPGDKYMKGGMMPFPSDFVPDGWRLCKMCAAKVESGS